MDRKRGLLIVFVVLLPFFLILFSYKVVFYFSDYNLEQKEVVDFLAGEKGLEIEMTTEEVSHLEDVKGVMKGIGYVFYFLLLVCSLVVTYGYRDRRYLGKLFLYGGVVTFVLVVLFLVFVLVDFGFIFTLFHRIFFEKGSWVFSADSFLIQTFPLGFFVSMVKKIIFLNLILAIVFIVGGISLKKKWTKKHY